MNRTAVREILVLMLLALDAPGTFQVRSLLPALLRALRP